MEFRRLLEKRQFVFVTGVILIAIIIIVVFLLTTFSKPKNPSPGEVVTPEEKMEILNYLSRKKDVPEVPMSEKRRVLEALSAQASEGEYQFSEEGKLQVLREVERSQ